MGVRFPKYSKPPVKAQERKPKEKVKHYCRECAHCYGDEYSQTKQLSYEKKPFLCHCDLGEDAPVKPRTDFNKYYKFLRDEACRRFEERASSK